jgi:ATP-binding cassette subfamily C protein
MSDATARSFRLRIVEAEDDTRVGREFELVESGTIGREKNCAVVLPESTVSRRHARIELGDDGQFKLTDLESGNGVWIGDERVTEITLLPGQHFRIGSTVLECRATNGAAQPSAEDRTVLIPVPAFARVPPTTVPTAIERIALKVIEGGEAVAAGTQLTIEARMGLLGRSSDCAVVVQEPDVSRRHAELSLIDGGLLVTDLNSSGGTWVGPRQIAAEVVRPGGRFRVGGRLVLEFVGGEAGGAPSDAAAPAASAAEGRARVDARPHTPPYGIPALPPPVEVPRAFERAATSEELATSFMPASEDDFNHTVVMPVPAELLASRGVEQEGELIEVSAQEPFLLNDPDVMYTVVSGGILIFTIPLEKGQPVGIRTHFLGVLPGQCFFGFDLSPHASGFLAVGRPGTSIRKLSVTRLRELAGMPGQARPIAALVDTWVAGLSKSLLRDFIAKAGNEVRLTRGATASLGAQQRATADEGVLWVDIPSRGVMFDELATPDFDQRSALFPLTPHSWLQPVSEEFGETVFRPTATEDLVGSSSLWYGLQIFHDTVCECEFISKKLAALDEYERQLQKQRHAQAAERAGYAAIGAVIRGGSETPREFLGAAAAEPVLRACQLVGSALGMTVKQHPTADEDNLSYEERVNAIASASGFRTRQVALRDDWWRYDHGPLLGIVEATGDPVALLPASARSFEYVNPKTGERGPVTPEVGATLGAFAHSFYRPFPPGELSMTGLIKFGAEGIVPDLRLVGVMAVVVGVFGTITPYFTGQIFDQAIPRAERQMLIGFGFALVAAAAATALFKLVQGIATVRVQAKMEHAIQSAVWDRILNLPTAFFRKYSAGDLADRAGGVDVIQTLISGAGVAAILGSVSGLFYVVQMFTYSMRLAAAAVALTVLFVTVNWLGNYLQLTHQRGEIQIRGRLQGLVLNLISGVNKLRLTGAESHAFRVWAQQFATQKSISLKVGIVQACMAVFSSVFPVLSSIVLFLVMIMEMQAAAESNARPLTTGEFIAFNAAYGLFLAAMQALGDASMSLLRIVPIYERLKPILMTEPEVDPSRAFPGRLTGEIEIAHISFRYAEDGPWILRDLSLKIKAGEFVAFVGGSGCGKSTLMRLMLGFERPSSGAIYYDGQDMNSLDVRLVRQQMGVVLQVSRVMPTEIYRNITGTSSRTIEDAWDAAEKAGLAEDIRNMPMGMHTYVSEGGGTLSGGQRQRLLIARAIVNKPKILFLDEATSALDNRAQAMVTESMDRMSATRIVIAHRLSTIINADKICYLEGGRVAEMGTYDELMAKGGLFAELARRQMA